VTPLVKLSNLAWHLIGQQDNRVLLTSDRWWYLNLHTIPKCIIYRIKWKAKLKIGTAEMRSLSSVQGYARENLTRNIKIGEQLNI
jgi:hypothetical protein